MKYLQQSFTVNFNYQVFFTSGLFDTANRLFADFLKAGSSRKILFVLDSGLVHFTPELPKKIRQYFDADGSIELVPEIIEVPGGEVVKSSTAYFDHIVEAVNRFGIDRHSYIAAIGGGSVLDMVGYAAAVSHRGIRHIRIPTTVLSQNDSGVGVKNGINFFGKKNFLGTFAPPAAVFNDQRFLLTLPDRDWRAGISEAIKVALIKDADFFVWLEANSEALMKRDSRAMDYLIERCAELHMEHIAGSDPFEMGSSRPLDFGHWSAHKLEQLTSFEVIHGEAVAIGMALDTMYSNVSGHLADELTRRIIKLIAAFDLPLTHQMMDFSADAGGIYQGLEEFREHLGGKLTIMLLEDIGRGIEVNSIDKNLLKAASAKLAAFQESL